MRKSLSKLSEILPTIEEGQAKRTVIRLYGDYIRTLRTFAESRRSEEDEALIADYNEVKEACKMAIRDDTNDTLANQDDSNKDSTIQRDAQEVARQEVNDAIARALEPFISNHQVNRVNLNELVCRPDTFNGFTPKPREWVEEYEEAFIANGWPDETAVKYFSTFLRASALDWYRTMVRPKFGASLSWQQLKRVFTDHYLGKDELKQRRQEFSSLVQSEKEPSNNFIPKAYRLLRQLYPRADEDEAIDKIVSKMRPEIIKSLPLGGVDTIEELVTFSSKIESRERQLAERMKHANRATRSSAQPFNRKPMNQEVIEKPKQQAEIGKREREQSKGAGPKCYRCLRVGHIGKNCTAAKAADGGPIRMPKSVSDPTNKVNQIQASKLSLNSNALIEDKVNTVKEKLVSNRMLFQILKCNGVGIRGLVDTGSYHSVIDGEVVRENGWTIDKPAPRLGAAGNNPLSCIGTCEIDVELTLGRRTRSTKFHFAVVENLGQPLLIGFEFVSLMQLLIDAENRQLFFKKASVVKKKPGIRTQEEMVIGPRTQKVIEASIPTVGTVLAIPNLFDGRIIVGNSVSSVHEGTVNLIVMNPTNQPVTIQADTQLASYEQIDDAIVSDVNRVVEIDGFEEQISIGEDLSEDQVRELSQLLQDNKNAFSMYGRIGELKDPRFFHRIELSDGAQPFNEPLRRRPKVHVDETRQQVQNLLKAGIIEESDSPFSSAYLLVKKKSGEYRLCIDFRRLNSITKKLVYPLPNIEECVDTLAGKNYFSLLDFSMGFHQLPMDKNSREYTAFKTEDGLFHFKRMPFGLANAPSSFQRMINATLMGLRGVNLQIFIDDICIASDTWPEHLAMLAKVLNIVAKSNLTLKSSKCVFGARQVLFLGHIISGEGVRQDPAKTKALLNMPRPKDAAGVRRALGMLGYYRKFIPGFAATSAPLTKLLKKNAFFKWSDTEEAAMSKLLGDLSEDVLLSQFNHEDPIAVKTDACKAGVAAMLLQLQRGEWRLIVCCSRRLNDHEINYGISELEALAIVYAVEKLRSYLLGKHFQILTDHSALSVLNNKNPTSSRLRRWALILQEFDYKIVYTKGQLQADVDCLSRAPIDPPDDAVERRIFHVAMPVSPTEWVENYSDEPAQRFKALALTGDQGFSLKNGTIYKNNALYVPTCMVTKLLREAHEGPLACHGGVAATTAVLEPYWWPNKANDVKAFVAECQACQARKVERAKPAGSMRSFEIFNANELVAIDHLGPLTETVGRNRHIILAIDCFTRYVFARSLPDKSADGYVEFLLDYVAVFGAPNRVLTDNALNFNSKRTKEVEKALGISHIFATPTHSQGNAVAERALQSLQEKINLVLKQKELPETSWDTVLPLAVFALNTSKHKSIGYSPYELRFGVEHRLISSVCETKPRSSIDAHVRNLNQQLDHVRTIAGSKQTEAQAAAKVRYDKGHRQVQFAVDDLVQVRASKRNSKLADKYDRICRVANSAEDIYKLVDLKTNQQLSRHVSKLKPYTAPQNTINLIQEINTSDTMARLANNRFVRLGVWLLMASRALGDLGFQTPRESFVIWKEDRQPVLKPKREYEIKISFVDPCIIIHRDFPDFWSTSSAEYNPVYYAYYGCTENYKKQILEPMDNLLDRYNNKVRTPRSIALLGLFGGLWLSNVIDSYFNDNDAIANHEKEQNAALELLNRKQNYSTQAVIELARSNHIMAEKINELYDNIDQQQRDFMKLQFALNWVNFHLGRKNSAIDKLRFDLVNGRRLNLHALNILLDTHVFENLDSVSLELL